MLDAKVGAILAPKVQSMESCRGTLSGGGDALKVEQPSAFSHPILTSIGPSHLS